MSDEDQGPRERPAASRDERADGSNRSAEPPWRTEGLPTGKSERPRRPRWLKLGAWIVGGYLVLFLLTTMQDQMSGGAEAIAYTEFTTQVEKGNVAEVFARGDTIEGRLEEAASVPGKTDTSYTKFTTERPTFANDDLYGALEKSGTTVRGRPPTAPTYWIRRCCGRAGSTGRSPCMRRIRRAARPFCECTREASRWPPTSTSVRWPDPLQGRPAPTWPTY